MEGWRAMLGADIDDENAATETYLFCPACAEREFGPASKGSRAAIGVVVEDDSEPRPPSGKARPGRVRSSVPTAYTPRTKQTAERPEAYRLPQGAVRLQPATSNLAPAVN
jgi:hypothetical protein